VLDRASAALRPNGGAGTIGTRQRSWCSRPCSTSEWRSTRATMPWSSRRTRMKRRKKTAEEWRAELARREDLDRRLRDMIER